MIRNWPTAATLMVGLVVVAATLIAGFAFDVDFRNVALVLGGESGIAMVILAAMRSFRDGRSRQRRRKPPPPLPVLLALALLLPGCGSSALSTHARAAIVTTSAVRLACDTATEFRHAERERVEREHPTDPEHDAAINEWAERWAPQPAACDAAGEAVSAWADSIAVAIAAEDDDLSLTTVLPLGQTALRLAAEMLALVRSLGVEVDGLPSWLTALMGGGS